MKNKSNRDLLLNGSIVKAILTLAIPVVINSFLQTMYNLTDTGGDQSGDAGAEYYH